MKMRRGPLPVRLVCRLGRVRARRGDLVSRGGHNVTAKLSKIKTWVAVLRF